MHWYVVLHGQENKKMIKIVVLNSSNNSICAMLISEIYLSFLAILVLKIKEKILAYGLHKNSG